MGTDRQHLLIFTRMVDNGLFTSVKIFNLSFIRKNLSILYRDTIVAVRHFFVAHIVLILCLLCHDLLIDKFWGIQAGSSLLYFETFFLISFSSLVARPHLLPLGSTLAPLSGTCPYSPTPFLPFDLQLNQFYCSWLTTFRFYPLPNTPKTPPVLSLLVA